MLRLSSDQIPASHLAASWGRTALDRVSFWVSSGIRLGLGMGHGNTASHQCQCAAHNSSSKLITHHGLWRLSFKLRRARARARDAACCLLVAGCQRLTCPNDFLCACVWGHLMCKRDGGRGRDLIYDFCKLIAFN